jgi:hypothetical protein
MRRINLEEIELTNAEYAKLAPVIYKDDGMFADGIYVRATQDGPLAVIADGEIIDILIDLLAS